MSMPNVLYQWRGKEKAVFINFEKIMDMLDVRTIDPPSNEREDGWHAACKDLRIEFEKLAEGED